MKILMAASEAHPYAKSGGLGDVIGALPAALARLGHEVKLFVPGYRSVKGMGLRMATPELSTEISIAGRKIVATVSLVRLSKIALEIYFVENEQYFDRAGLYLDPATGQEYEDNDERFLFFCRTVLEFARKLGFSPDIVHAHDWQTSLLPVYLKLLYGNDPVFASSKSVLTIHNLAYQGTFPAKSFPKFGLPDELFAPTSPFEFYGKVNLLKAGILHADKITTVSERYAQEIQTTSELGCGLEGVLSGRSADLVGILNGVDYLTWSPSRDKHLTYRYRPANLSGKRVNKVDLLNASGLPVRDDAPLIGIISRLVDQKGFDLIAEIADELLSLNVQLIVLGTGDEKYHRFFENLERDHPTKVKAYLTFDESMAHRIEAASDMFLMPSKFEPCGLNQMYSLKYGTVPVVREVGGLADTIVEFDPDTGKGNGFVFKEYDAAALMSTIRRAVSTYQRRRVWTKIMKNGMAADFSWASSAGKYVNLFESLAG